jgi:hypothetical protein
MHTSGKGVSAMKKYPPDERAYFAHKHGAKQRGIGFHLTFYEWLTIWECSRHLNERGGRSADAADSYVMARFNDAGDYKLGNVKIITLSENSKEAARIPRRVQKEAGVNSIDRRLTRLVARLKRQPAPSVSSGFTQADGLDETLSASQ